MRPADLPAVVALADLIHPDHPEDGAVLAEKLALFPDGCLSLERHGAVVGYCLSHPWRRGSVPSLDTLLHTLPAAPTTYFVHDVALHPDQRGQGLARSIDPILDAVCRRARLQHLSLVSVHGTQAFWQRLGFFESDDLALRQAARAAYGPGATPMERVLSAGR